MQFQAADVVRGGSRGKAFWHAEATGGPLWLQPQVLNRPLDDGRSSEPEDVRVWSLIDMAAGASGILFTRWRPLLDGPLFGAFGPMGMDGSVTPRAQMAGKLARWTNAHPDLWQSRPVKGDVGIVFVQESLDFASIQNGAGEVRAAAGRGAAAGGAAGSAGNYLASAQGAYQAFFDSNIQADFVSVDDIGEYPLVYLPYPEMLTQATADKLRAYVAGGGSLVERRLSGVFRGRRHGRRGAAQPGPGPAVRGARKLRAVHSRPARQAQPHHPGPPTRRRLFPSGVRAGRGPGRRPVRQRPPRRRRKSVGRGRTLLVGTFPGAAYARGHAPEAREFFADLLAWAGLQQKVRSSDPKVKARLHEGAGGTHLWVVNPTRTSRTVKITLPSSYTQAEELWQESGQPVLAGNLVTATIGERDAAVIRLG